jgi:DNA polymerase III delta subunit
MGSLIEGTASGTNRNSMIFKDIPSIYRTSASLEKPFRSLKIEAKDDFFREDCVEKYVDFWKKYAKTGDLRRVLGTEFITHGDLGNLHPGLFSGKTLWVIDGASGLKGQKLDSFCSYIQTANEDHFFLCVEKEAAPKSLEVEAAILFPTLKPWERQPWIVKWIEAFLKKQEKVIAGDAAALLASAFLDNRCALVGELEKLVLYRLNETAITVSDVRAISAIDIQPTMWQLIDALLKKDAKMIATCLLAADMNDIGMLRFVKNQLQKLVIAAQEDSPVKLKSQERQVACIRNLGAHTVIKWINRLEQEDVSIRAGKEENASLLPLFLSFCR